jgi:hypothetical protein
MKYVWIGLVLSMLYSCSKENAVNPKVSGLEDGGASLFPKPRLPRQVVLSQCVDDYAAFASLFSGTTLNIIAVVLENGTRIEVGGSIVSMVYHAQASNETLSLFRSIFDVTHLVGGVEHHVWWNVWSRGCYRQRPGDPFYTNLLRGSEVIEINSSFKWGIDPYKDVPIRYLVIE